MFEMTKDNMLLMMAGIVLFGTGLSLGILSAELDLTSGSEQKELNCREECIESAKIFWITCFSPSWNKTVGYRVPAYGLNYSGSVYEFKHLKNLTVNENTIKFNVETKHGDILIEQKLGGLTNCSMSRVEEVGCETVKTVCGSE